MTDWDMRFIELAKHFATWSKDPSTKVGCVVVDEASRRVLSHGYNGFPQGVEDLTDRYQERAQKYRYVVHADQNAIYTASRLGVSLVGATMYLNAPPCHECMKGIIQAGIKRVVWPEDNPLRGRVEWSTSMMTAQQMAEEAGVKMGAI